MNRLLAEFLCSSTTAPNTRIVRLVIAATLALSCGLSAAAVHAEDTYPTRIEEDWEIQIGVADNSAVVPEIVTVLTPSAGLVGDYFVFELNHATLPTFFTGGMQLQRWRNGDVLKYRNGPTVQCLHWNNDTIRFTSALEVSDGQLSMSVMNGTARSWGTFGGTDMRITTATLLTDLRTYSPSISVALSKVSFGRGYVRSFRLVSTRYFANGQLLREDTQVRNVE